MSAKFASLQRLTPSIVSSDASMKLRHFIDESLALLSAVVNPEPIRPTSTSAKIVRIALFCSKCLEIWIFLRKNNGETGEFIVGGRKEGRPMEC